MKKKGLFKKRARASDEMSLQITSMADIFTILLVFLLKSASTSAVNITPGAGVTLPASTAEQANIEALRIEISENAVTVENEPVLKLEKFAVDPKDVTPEGGSKLLSSKLEISRKRQLLIAKSNSDVKVDSKVIIIADQKTPYSTIKRVLASAAVQGYTDYKLAVVNKNQ